MNPRTLDYQFSVAPRRALPARTARCQPDAFHPPAAETASRHALWRETQGLVQREGGVLVLDDTTLDKPYASGYPPLWWRASYLLA